MERKRQGALGRLHSRERRNKTPVTKERFRKKGSAVAAHMRRSQGNKGATDHHFARIEKYENTTSTVIGATKYVKRPEDLSTHKFSAEATHKCGNPLCDRTRLLKLKVKANHNILKRQCKTKQIDLKSARGKKGMGKRNLEIIRDYAKAGSFDDLGRGKRGEKIKESRGFRPRKCTKK